MAVNQENSLKMRFQKPLWLCFALAACAQPVQVAKMHFSLGLDHLVIAARTLEEGAAYVEAVLGLGLTRGGKHPHMGTHNLLLSLGDQEYLEVIAIDPGAEPPDRPRWYSLDEFRDAPRMTNWAVRTDDLDAALDEAPEGSGEVFELERGDLRWAMAVPQTGRLPFDNAMPALIEWDTNSAHPCNRLPDYGARLQRLDVFHPDADRLKQSFQAFDRLPHVDFRQGPEKRLIATITTPEGTRVLA